VPSVLAVPRLAPLGRAAPWLNHVLFTLYHFWQPWQYVSILLFALPLTFVPWKTGNIRVAMVAQLPGQLNGRHADGSSNPGLSVMNTPGWALQLWPVPPPVR
jgi:hypothetical protein